MLRKLKKLSNVETRLLLAACLCAIFFAASSSSSDSDQCSSSPQYVGYSIHNETSWTCLFKVTGPESEFHTLPPKTVVTSALKVGTYVFKATLTTNLDGNVNIMGVKSGGFTLIKGVDTTVTIKD